MVKTEDSGTKEKPAAEKMPKAGVSKLKLFVWLVVILAVIGAAAYPQAVKKRLCLSGRTASPERRAGT